MLDVIELRMLFLDKAESLGELGSQALAYLMEDARIPDRWEFALSRRLRWVAGFKWTLDECAKTEGVTRERMRQLQKQVEGVPLRIPHPPRILDQVVELASSAESLEAFWSTLKARGIYGDQEAWDRESLLEVFIKLGNAEIQDRLGKELTRLTPTPMLKKFVSEIREYRTSLLGFVDLHALGLEMGLSTQEVRRMLNEIYKIVLGKGNLVVAIGVPPGSFIAVVTKQLAVNPNASVEELYEGILRFRSQRNSNEVVSLREFETVLFEIFGDPPNVNNLPKELQAEAEFNGCELAFISEFKRSDRHTLHRDELVSAAVASGEKASSASVWLSTSTVMRPSGFRRGYYQLV